jgi:tetratricopeptide (TPR) repeat protein
MAGPDGQGLIIEKLSISIAAHGPLSLTEMDIVFRNPQNRQIEGKFQATLPVGATISRFAKEVDGNLMEGEVVERKEATRIYTEILHTMRDPALLQQDQGNVFNARIFPIAAKATTRILLSYSQVTAASSDGLRRLTIPLKGLENIKQFELLALCRPLNGETVFTVDENNKEKKVKAKDSVIFAEELSEDNYTPKEDMVLIFRPGKNRNGTFLKAGEFEMVSIIPDVPAGESQKGSRNWAFYIDSSASMADRNELRMKVLSNMLKEFGSDEKLSMNTFDLSVSIVGNEIAGNKEGTEKLLKKVTERQCLGGTDFVKLCKTISEDGAKRKEPVEYVIVTDGVATFGSKEVKDILDALNLPRVHKLSVLVAGSTEDNRLTEALAEKGGGRVVRIPLTSNWEANTEEGTSELRKAYGVTVQLYDENAKWIEPSIFRDVRPGMELIAFSSISEGKSSLRGMTWTDKSTGKVTDMELKGKVETIPDFAPLLEREGWHSKLTYLEKLKDETSDVKKRTRLDNEMIEISTKHRVLCSLTSLLVLESESDYMRFGITRKGLSDVLVIGSKGVELKKRVLSADIANKIAKKKEEEAEALRQKNERLKQDESKAKALYKKASSAYNSLVDSISGSSDSFDSMDMEKSTPDAGNVPMEESFSTSRDEALGNEGGSGDRRSDSFGGAPAGAVESLSEVSAELAPPSPAPSVSGRMNMASSREIASPRREAVRQSAFRPAPDTTGSTQTSASIDSDSTDNTVSDDAINYSDSTEEDHVFSEAPEPSDIVRNPSSMPRRPSGNYSAPEWVKDAHYVPSQKTIDKLARDVEKSPRDRQIRNSYCWALAKAKSYELLLAQALDWQKYDFRNPMLYEFAGLAYEALNDDENAARAYASIAEVSPGSSGLLNRGGYLLMRLGMYSTAETLFRFAIDRRPDHHNNYRGLALALWYEGKHKEAADVLVEVISKNHNSRYGNIGRVLKEELGYVLRGWYRSDPSKLSDARSLAKKQGVNLDRTDDLRITLHWETDANDVDLHVVDPNNEECYYSHKVNESKLNLYEDLTNGLGPEVVSAPAGTIAEGPYHVGVKYFSAGPMGVSRGIVLIQKEDNSGKPQMQIEPFTLLPSVDGSSKDMRHIAVWEN